MQIGLIGTPEDGRIQGLRRFLEDQDAEVIFVDSHSFQNQEAWCFDAQGYHHRGRSLEDVKAWYMATYPPALPSAWTDYDSHFLYSDWYVDYMHKREHRTFFLSWLLSLSRRGIPMINPPEHAVGIQLKPLELQIARQVGLEIPATLISNAPEQIRAFTQNHSTVYKPLAGYGTCRPFGELEHQHLERVCASPVIFQERIVGTAVRVTAVDGQLVSCVRIPSESLDYRDNAAYESGQQVYEPTELPSEIAQRCQHYLREAGLLLAGIDLIATPDGRYVFLEANSSPMYLEIERRTRHPITFEICTALLKHANEPARYRSAQTNGRMLQGFTPYVLPFGENLWT
ncbi:MAG: ATP-grasp domain-containing protein [Candidatus Sericytochromatia bacterium]